MVSIGPVTLPDHGLSYTSSDVCFKIGEKCLGYGHIIISKDLLSWKPNDEPDGITFSWTNISAHGISNLPSKCIYFMVNEAIVWPGKYDPSGTGAGGWRPPQEDDDDDCNSDDEDFHRNQYEEEDSRPKTTSCWLLPRDQNTIEMIFRAFTECQSLYPDHEDAEMMLPDLIDEDDESQVFRLTPPLCFTPESDRLTDPMDNLSLNDNDDIGRFDDADE